MPLLHSSYCNLANISRNIFSK